MRILRIFKDGGRGRPRDRDTANGSRGNGRKIAPADSDTAPRESGTSPARPSPLYRGPAEKPPLTERENAGRRIMRAQTADAWQAARDERNAREPFIRHIFDTPVTARDALLELPFIHEARDTGNLVCSLPLTFGHYRLVNGKYEALLGGREMTWEIWATAETSFRRRGGISRGTMRPDRGAGSPPGRTNGRVTFVREYTQVELHRTRFYRVFRAADAVSARSFLKKRENVVFDDTHFVRVETPQGNFCRDREGIRREIEGEETGE